MSQHEAPRLRGWDSNPRPKTYESVEANKASKLNDYKLLKIIGQVDNSFSGNFPYQSLMI